MANNRKPNAKRCIVQRVPVKVLKNVSNTYIPIFRLVPTGEIKVIRHKAR